MAPVWKTGAVKRVGVQIPPLPPLYIGKIIMNRRIFIGGLLSVFLILGCTSIKHNMYYVESKKELDQLKIELKAHKEKIIEVQFSKEVGIYSVKTKQENR